MTSAVAGGLRRLLVARPTLAAIPRGRKLPSSPVAAPAPAPKTNFSTTSSALGVINIQDEEDFKTRVIASSVPVVIDFHANWCGPCKILGPRLESIVDGHGDAVVMAKVDIDELGELASAFRVQAVPTVVAVRDGKIVDGFTGVKDEDQLKSFVDKLVEA